MNASTSPKDVLLFSDNNKASQGKHQCLDLWYKLPPHEELTLDEFEEYALKRLKVCSLTKVIMQAS